MQTLSELEFTKVQETPAAPDQQAPAPTPAPEQTPAPAPAKKRGRPKKGEKKPEGDGPTFEKPKEAGSIFDEIKKEVEQNEQNLNNLNASQPGAASGETPIHSAVKNIVDGYMLLTLMDTFFPMILKLAYKKAKRLKDKDIQLSKDQKEHLEPIADEIAQQLLSFMDPVSLFFVMAGAMYWQNTSEALANAK